MATPLSLRTHLPSPPPPHLNTTKTKSNAQIETNPSLISLEKCSNMADLKQIHAQMIKTNLVSNPFAVSRIIAFCALENAGDLRYARVMFEQIPNPNNFTCNSMIRGYTNKNLTREAIHFYRETIELGLLPDRFTFPSLFKSCGDSNEGKQLHAHTVKFGFASDSYVQNTLINMYVSRDHMSDARKVFDKMTDRNVVSWATMIAGYANWDRSVEAMRLFRRMEVENVKPNEVALVNVLMACARARDLDMAKWVHEYMDENQIGFNLILMASLMDVYCKCGAVSLARKLFDELPERNLFCWNIMINGHVEDSNYKEALLLFREMQHRGLKADKVTMASLMIACSHLGALELGKWLHFYINKEKVEVDVVLGTALVDMYAKCGCIKSASQVFDDMPRRDVMTWTAMIGGLAMSGHGGRALEFFYDMQKSGVKPDAITFVGVLTACSHTGLVDEGYRHFESMSTVYGIRPSVEHYGCMVDLLSRAGLIEKAEELIRNMPMTPDYFVLGALLGACRIHGNIEVAERAARQLLELNPGNGGAYVLLSNIYGSMKKWDESKRTRDLMVEKNIQKPPGCSLIEVDGAVHEFVKGDVSHPRTVEIYAMVDDMIRRLKDHGYVPNKSEVLFDLDEEDKEDELCRHSEKLAIAFGLISTSPGMPIRVVKNLRVCSDCHSATKLIAQVYDREITVRDRNRFHHFKDGSCSCKDFW